ncbi:MAG: hypothetical protein HY049_10470 [Acidobacteria bacterium]|nr:hypothetical protein [Acidobacteriota bacterium]
MPGSYLIDAARGIVFSRGWGVVVDDELLAHSNALASDPRFQPSWKQVADFREVTEIRLTSRGVHSNAETSPFARDARRAFVVVTDEAFGISRMFSLYADTSPDQFRIFRELPQAMAWIGLDPAEPWPSAEPDRIFGAT